MYTSIHDMIRVYSYIYILCFFWVLLAIQKHLNCWAIWGMIVY